MVGGVGVGYSLKPGDWPHSPRAAFQLCLLYKTFFFGLHDWVTFFLGKFSEVTHLSSYIENCGFT